MAILSGVPNFYSASALTGADMDAALGSVVQQIGGIRYVSGVAANSPSNLDVSNFADNPGFSNSQKQEPASRLNYTGAPGFSPTGFNDAMFPGTGVGGTPTFGYVTWFPPTPVAMFVYAVTFSYAAAVGDAIPAPGASVALFLNGRPMGDILTIPAAGLKAGDVFKADIAIDLAPDDVPALQIPTTFVSGTSGGSAYLTGVQLGLWCRLLHVA